jgi:hypothetical protein
VCLAGVLHPARTLLLGGGRSRAEWDAGCGTMLACGGNCSLGFLGSKRTHGPEHHHERRKAVGAFAPPVVVDLGHQLDTPEYCADQAENRGGDSVAVRLHCRWLVGQEFVWK